MNNIDEDVEVKIRKCALNDTVPLIFSDTTEAEEEPSNKEQSTGNSEDFLSETQKQYYRELTKKMKKELHVAAPENVEQEMEKSLLVKEASKFYAEPHELQEMEQKQDVDNVNHPQHYTGGIECIDAMLQQFGKEQVKSFCLLNAFKYLFRCNKKHNTPIEDVKKAIWYLNKYIEIVNNI